MAVQNFVNNVTVYAAQLVGATDTAITFDDVSALPNVAGGDFFLLTFFRETNGVESLWEIVKGTAVDFETNIVTVVRGQEGTTARAWSIGSKAQMRATAGTLGKLRDDIPAPVDLTSINARIDTQNGLATNGSLVPVAQIVSIPKVKTDNPALDTPLNAQAQALSDRFSYLISNDGAKIVGLKQSGLGAVTRTLFDKNIDIKSIKENGAVIDGVANDSSSVQSAFTDYLYISATEGDALISGVTIPASVKAIVGATRFKAASNSSTVLQVMNDTSRSHGKCIDGIEINGNDKTNVIGLKYGAVTNNPVAGAKEAVLYVDTRNVTVRGCETGVQHDVSMEHTATNLACISNTVGMKIYGDAVNGGGNANTFSGFRANGNQVGLMVAANANYPLSNNTFYGPTFQENTLCGVFMQGYGVGGPVSAQTIDGAHFEGNAVGGTASVVIDSKTVLRSDIHLDNYASLVLQNSDVASNANPFAIVNNHSTLYAHNVTGYGQQMGLVYSVDSTSKVFESGYCIGTGIKYVESYGMFATPGPGVCTTIGAPLIEIGQYPNNSPLTSSVVPAITNPVGVTVGTATDATYGEVSTVQFLASIGNTGANKFHWYGGGGTSGNFFINSFLVQSSVDASFYFDSWRDARYQQVPVDLKAGVWRRIVVVGMLNSSTGLQMYIYPNDSVGAMLSFKGYEYIDTPDLGVINSIYSRGLVGDGGIGAKTVASAGSLMLPESHDGSLSSVTVSGTSSVTFIYPTGWAGKTVVLIFQDALTVTNGSNLKLNGNFVTTGNDTITLTCDGVNWYEIARSIN